MAREGTKVIGDEIMGLNNPGNAYYMNNAVQCLSHIPLLTEYFLPRVYVDVVEVQPPGK